MTAPIALITGASRGIGAATAQLAAEAGYDVCINYSRDHTRAESCAQQCRAKGVRAITIQADVADPQAVNMLFKQCDTDLGSPTLLVNNAGIIGAASRVEALTTDALQQTFAVNVYGTIYCSQHAIKRMSTTHGGQGGVIINLSSIAASLGSPGEYVHYAASKAAIETFTIGLSKEVGAEGIRVNAVQAGTTDTEIHATAGNPDRPQKVAATAPLGRVATPQDIAESIIWLASDKASYATGSIVRIGGGL